MQKRFSTGLIQKITAIGENQLAVIAALLLEASIRHFIYPSQSVAQFVWISGQLMLESLPLLLAHYFAFKYRSWRALIIWTVGFIFYPVLSIALANFVSWFADWHLFSEQLWVFLMMASLGFGVSHILAKRDNTKAMLFMSRLFSLNSVLVMLLVAWAILWAGIFASTDDPVRNQPIKAIINSDVIIVNFAFFIDYLWQFLVMGLLVLLLYWINRYILIRRILARSGVFAYVAACLICIIVMTPIWASVVLLLPMNIPQWTFLPSEDYNIFSPINFRFCFIILAVSAPIILAFERQQHDKALAEIAQRQSQTELQLLQQQVNPHFLFNTLNNLYALTLIGSKDAPELLMQLANLLRYTVYEGQNNRVSLEQEIRYIQDFLSLQAIRSGDKCQLTVHYPDGAQNWQIAPLLLIIIIENVFKHGVEPSQSSCSVNIDIQVKDGRLLMQCNNSLPEIHRKRKPGIGLENLKRRLALLYAGKHSLRAKEQNGEWHSLLSLELEPCSLP
jgi:hypothetical protein